MLASLIVAMAVSAAVPGPCAVRGPARVSETAPPSAFVAHYYERCCSMCGPDYYRYMLSDSCGVCVSHAFCSELGCHPNPWHLTCDLPLDPRGDDDLVHWY